MTDKVINLSEVRHLAEDYYRRGDFYCSEAVVKTIKDVFDLDISDDAIAMASGFPVGIGGSGCTCGAINGGVMCIGMVFGRREAKDDKVQTAMKLSGELHDNFKHNNKHLCCRILTRGMIKGSKKHMDQCIRLTGDVAYDCAKIICRELNLQIED
ncbi:C-GCAxxG-C-C family (seleno)protein [Candidatus Epulonipiscium viviparus]|uniref:C-GCAxxG-C-C family (seleno)protein n=1 Tax=Candidatus Epulonipiscium viviparus TaxID=420336 RepID=UPI0027380F06|nr:C-GCAxxG-C-C family (seleno)protein [Candidatus Epulopiscium viviparus]